MGPNATPTGNPSFQLTPPVFGSRLPSIADRLTLGVDLRLKLGPDYVREMIPMWLDPHYFFTMLAAYPLPGPGLGLLPIAAPRPPGSPALPPAPPAPRVSPVVSAPDQPRAGTVGDLLKAAGGLEPVKLLKEQAERRLTGDWKSLGTGGQIFLGSYAGAMVAGGGAAAYITDPDARKLILQSLRDKPIPIPSTPLSLTILASDEAFTGMILRIDLASVLGGKK
ncbi:hypothetical protein [Dyadobacter sandarakinus]|uniref:Uncharacterized protein n=1 Tax=Dyadobacter sandarakinus TaxID=2747268 RepID=A0ABX7I3F7_9BACT|nr:hypothetical protein [Dyadobacter sandarakinus]QRR00601.1 hypothetical protein HWI92_06615 [Dyadobacter sandarakinus]